MCVCMCCYSVMFLVVESCQVGPGHSHTPSLFFSSSQMSFVGDVSGDTIGAVADACLHVGWMDVVSECLVDEVLFPTSLSLELLR